MKCQYLSNVPLQHDMVKHVVRALPRISPNTIAGTSSGEITLLSTLSPNVSHSPITPTHKCPYTENGIRCRDFHEMILCHQVQMQRRRFSMSLKLRGEIELTSSCRQRALQTTSPGQRGARVSRSVSRRRSLHHWARARTVTGPRYPRLIKIERGGSFPG